jgi:hypothetical protein
LNVNLIPNVNNESYIREHCDPQTLTMHSPTADCRPVRDIGSPQPDRGRGRPADFGQSDHSQKYQHGPVDGRPEFFFVQESVKMTAALL